MILTPFNMNGVGGGTNWWGPDSLVLSTTLFNWRQAFNGLPEEIKAYLTEHEHEIHSEEDVDRLVRLANLKK